VKKEEDCCFDETFGGKHLGSGLDNYCEKNNQHLREALLVKVEKLKMDEVDKRILKMEQEQVIGGSQFGPQTREL
ncbi:hypothetical protein, partial [Alteromonas stellipolaris]|uniref:hypothetical protein n=1 Tax=Alteromonas stellipolaris TaxID=233316 RepID=UPI001D6E8A25